MEQYVISMKAENRRLMAENAALRSEIISLHLQKASQRQAPAAVINGDLIIGNNNKNVGNNSCNINSTINAPQLVNALFAQLQEKDRQIRKLLSAMSADLIKKTLNTNEQ